MQTHDGKKTRRDLPLLIGTFLLFMATGSLAGPIEYLFRNERVCDVENVFCLRGTLSYQSNPRLLRLSARVQKSPGPGQLRILLSGKSAQGHRHFAPFEVRLRGGNSEIIDHKMIPDYPEVQSWVVEEVRFVRD